MDGMAIGPKELPRHCLFYRGLTPSWSRRTDARHSILMERMPPVGRWLPRNAVDPKTSASQRRIPSMTHALLLDAAQTADRSSSRHATLQAHYRTERVPIVQDGGESGLPGLARSVAHISTAASPEGPSQIWLSSPYHCKERNVFGWRSAGASTSSISKKIRLMFLNKCSKAVRR